ncbi:MAG: alpha/beta hydrolase [Fimbriimonadaceae bacterium]
MPALGRPLSVAMIHGAGGGAWEFRLWRRVFERAGWAVIAEDLRPGPQGLARTSLADYRAQVLEWPRGALAPDAAIGASMGGWLALHAAEAWRAEALVLINPVPPCGAAARWQPAGPIPEIVPWSRSTLQDTALALPDADPAVVRWAAARWRDESGLVLRELAAGAEAPRPSCPTLVVVSERDTDVPPEASLAVARWCGAETAAIPGASHVGPLLGSSASSCARLALDWIQRALASHARRERDHE